MFYFLLFFLATCVQRTLKSRLAGSDKKKRLAFNVEALSVGVSFAFIDLKIN